MTRCRRSASYIAVAAAAKRLINHLDTRIKIRKYKLDVWADSAQRLPMFDHLKRIGVTFQAIRGWAAFGTLVVTGATIYLAWGWPAALLIPLILGIIVLILVAIYVAIIIYDHFAAKKFRAKPNYEKWDEVTWLADWQAACLWDDIEPYSPVADRTPSFPTLQMLKSAAIDNLLGTSKLSPVEGWSRYPRDALRDFARSKGIRPFAFFPEIRDGNSGEVGKVVQITVDLPIPIETTSPSIDEFLYMGRIETSASNLLSDYQVRLHIIAFNGNAFPITYKNLSGTIRYRVDGQSSYTVLPTAQFLKLHFSDPVKPRSEFVIEVAQHLSGVVANEMSDAFARGAKVEFELLELRIEIQSANDAKAVAKIPLWGGISCAKFGERIVTGKISYATGHLKAGAATILT